MTNEMHICYCNSAGFIDIFQKLLNVPYKNYSSLFIHSVTILPQNRRLLSWPMKNWLLWSKSKSIRLTWLPKKHIRWKKYHWNKKWKKFQTKQTHPNNFWSILDVELVYSYLEKERFLSHTSHSKTLDSWNIYKCEANHVVKGLAAASLIKSIAYWFIH